MSDGSLVTRKDDGDGVSLVVLRNPPVNALGRTLLGELDHRIGEIEDDPTVRAVVLTGDGAYFSAGADVKEMASIRADAAPQVVAEGQHLFSRIAALRPPVIAAINGLAVGGGLELALACDVRIASESAKLGAPEVVYGLMPAYGGTQRLPRLVGDGMAREIIFSGNLLPAADALRIGLVNRSVPAGQEVRAARDLAHTIASRAPKAVQAAKRAIREGVQLPLTKGLDLERSLFEREVLASEDLVEGLKAFVERRPPKFRGA